MRTSFKTVTQFGSSTKTLSIPNKSLQVTKLWLY